MTNFENFRQFILDRMNENNLYNKTDRDKVRFTQTLSDIECIFLDINHEFYATTLETWFNQNVNK